MKYQSNRMASEMTSRLTIVSGKLLTDFMTESCI